jgi:CRP/FNR family cyclic AMP-dependent transcriptional regulator
LAYEWTVHPGHSSQSDILAARCQDVDVPTDVLALTSSHPDRTLAAGDVLFSEGDDSTNLIVLVEGELVIEAAGIPLHRDTAPGTFVGEVGALLLQPRSATITAAAPTVVRDIGDAAGAFARHPELGIALARQLAARVHRLVAYVTDVQRQFGEHDSHLGMFPELLHRIAHLPPVEIEPGSDRAPDY